MTALDPRLAAPVRPSKLRLGRHGRENDRRHGGDAVGDIVGERLQRGRRGGAGHPARRRGDLDHRGIAEDAYGEAPEDALAGSAVERGEAFARTGVLAEVRRDRGDDGVARLRLQEAPERGRTGRIVARSPELDDAVVVAARTQAISLNKNIAIT